MTQVSKKFVAHGQTGPVGDVAHDLNHPTRKDLKVATRSCGHDDHLGSVPVEFRVGNVEVQTLEIDGAVESRFAHAVDDTHRVRHDGGMNEGGHVPGLSICASYAVQRRRIGDCRP